jgi:hypothetical protein
MLDGRDQPSLNSSSNDRGDFRNVYLRAADERDVAPAEEQPLPGSPIDLTNRAHEAVREASTPLPTQNQSGPQVPLPEPIDLSPQVRKDFLFIQVSFGGLALLALGMAIILLIPQWEPACPPHCDHIYGGLTLIGLGIMPLVALWLFTRQYRRAPRLLTFKDAGFTLGFVDGSTLSLDWHDPSLFIPIAASYDFPPGTGACHYARFQRKGVDIVLDKTTKSGSPIPTAAYDSLVSQAKLHGCWVFSIGGDGATFLSQGWTFIHGARLSSATMQTLHNAGR